MQLSDPVVASSLSADDVAPASAVAGEMAPMLHSSARPGPRDDRPIQIADPPGDRIGAVRRACVQATPAAGALTIATHTEAKQTILVLCGEIDLASVGELERALRDAAAASPKSIVVDLAGVEFIDVVGLRTLVHTLERDILILRRIPHQAHRLFELMQLHVHRFDSRR